MTVRDMLDLYQSEIDCYYKRIYEYFSKKDARAEMFYRGVSVGFNKAYIELAKYEDEGLEPSKEEKEDD